MSLLFVNVNPYKTLFFVNVNAYKNLLLVNVNLNKPAKGKTPKWESKPHLSARCIREAVSHVL